MLGVNCLYGESNPTDPIAGVSGWEDCSFDDDRFKIIWKNVEKFKNTKKSIISLIEKIKEDKPTSN